MNKFLLLLSFVFFIKGQTYPSWKVQLIKHLKPDTYFSGCWGWYDPVKQREYAISASKKGTWFVDITNPANISIVDSVIGIPINVWREVKTYKNYCYVISDDYMNTFQIIDLSYLPDSVHVIASPHLGLLRKGHTLWIDRHYLYVGIPTDSNNVLHSMGVFKLHPDPKNPVFLRWLDQDFPSINQVHDMFVRNDTVFASAANQGLYVYKYDTIQNKFIYISSLTSYLEAGYNHSSALTSNGKTLVFMDEIPTGLSIKIANVSNLSNMQIINYLKPYNNNNFVAHNPFIIGNRYLVASCYQDGTLIYDISTPQNPVLVGYFDTYPQGGAHQGGVYSTGYNGNWGSYPFFPSGLILSNDMTNGIFILKADTLTDLSKLSTLSSDEISAFPSPCYDMLHITVPREKINTITMLDVFGKQIAELIPHSSPFGSTINTSSLTPGIYFAEYHLKEGYSIRKKFIRAERP